jgi:hypothetical protein
MEQPQLTESDRAQRREVRAPPLDARPAHWGVDLDRASRPGVPRERPPESWPNTRFPPTRQHGKPASPAHGRPGKDLPPVFGTAVPLAGLSGLVRRLGYRYPDHYPRHWLLELLGDRVDAWNHRLRRLAPWAMAAGLAVFLVRRARA